MDPVTLSATSSQALKIEYMATALWIVVISEYICSVFQEINYIWKGLTCNLVNIIFFTCRYTPFLSLILGVVGNHTAMNDTRCIVGYNMSIWVAAIGLTSAELCFIFQAYVLWGESRKVTIFLSLLTLGLVTGITVVMAFDTVHRQSVNPGIPDAFLSSLSFTRCVIMASKEEPSTMEMIYAIVLATGTIVTTMITWSRARRYRGTTSHILLLLHRNSVIYFVLNLCVALPIFSIGTRVEFIQPALGHCGCAISSVVASRMILALKACNDQTTTTILSPIWFKQVFSASSGDSEDSGIAYRRESLSNASSIV